MAGNERSQDAWPLGAKLKEARLGLRLSQTEAARRAGFSTTVWGQLESGRRSVGDKHSVPARPKPQTVVAAAQVVGLDVDKALRLAGHESQTFDPSTGGSPSISERELLKKFSMLTERQRAAVAAVMESMLEPEPAEAAEDEDTLPFPLHDRSQVSVRRYQDRAGRSHSSENQQRARVHY